MLPADYSLAIACAAVIAFIFGIIVGGSTTVTYLKHKGNKSNICTA